MEVDIRVQCLVFIVHGNGLHQRNERSPTCTRKLRSSTAREQLPRRCTAPRTLRSTVSSSVPLARAFVLLPKVFLREHHSLRALFQQNNILVVNYENVDQLLVGNNCLEVFEILFNEKPSASVNHLCLIAPARYLNLTRLLFSNVKVRKNYESQNTVTRPAVDNVNLKYIKRLLNYGEVYLEFGYDNFFGSYNGTLLHMAIFRNNVDLALSLLRYGADAHRKNYLYGDSTLHLAARYCPPLIQVLIDKGVSVDIVDDFGANPLHDASTVEAAEILLQNGANVNSTDKRSRTPLFRAVEGWRMRVIRTLLDYGADAYVVDNRNRTLLEPAYLSHEPKLLKFLLDVCFSKASILSESSLMDFYFYKICPTERQSLGYDPYNIPDCAAVMARHFLIMQALAEHVTMTSQPATSSLLKEFKEELVKISMHKLRGTNISLCDILTMNTDRIACLLRNEDIISGIYWSQDFETHFPMYGTILKYRLEKGRHRRDIQQEAVKICSRLFRNFKNIPDEIYWMIVVYLTTQDVMILKRVCG